MSEQPTFSIHLDDFDGPLALLYDLIKKSQMNIYDIQIAEITDQYLKHIRNLKQLDVNVASDYFLLAADLMAIKSKMLLPQPMIEEEQEDSDPRDDLVARLLIYQEYQRNAQKLAERFQIRHAMHSRSAVMPEQLNHPDERTVQISVKLLKAAFQKVVIRQRQQPRPSFAVHEWQFSIPEQTQMIKKALRKYKQIDLVLFLEQHSQIEELVTTFLAILEMAKRQQLKIIQDEQKILLQGNGDQND